LSGSDNWPLADGHWMPKEFYSAIMLMFGIREEDEWVTETLAWWNGCIFLSFFMSSF
ncbi:hypothetical protein L208DRAFT_1295496, partial [Tricholoma matsutake]